MTRAYGILVAVAVWSILPPYAGPALGLELDVSSTVEAVDHLIPGLLAIGGATVAFVLTRRGRGDSTLAFAALSVCALSGLDHIIVEYDTPELKT